MAISQTYLDVTIGNLETLHGRFANELCNILKRHTGKHEEYYELVSVNNIVGKVIDILYDYIPYGNSTLNDLANGLTETEMESLIKYSYKVLNKYTNNIFIPTDPNVYL